ncbi:MAG: hypothetical protein IJA34_13425 [Lachnospiraceae bacterium]|nr:hypothetical protein [Lachnospiraceae bacterium]
MGIISEKKRKIKSKAERALIEEVIKRLESAIELKEKGKETEGDAVVNDMKEWLDGIIKGIENDISNKELLAIDRSYLPQTGEVIAEGAKIILSVIREDERKNYLTVSYEHSFVKNAYKDEQFVENTWKEFLSASSFVCSIYEKNLKNMLDIVWSRIYLKGIWN